MTISRGLLGAALAAGILTILAGCALSGAPSVVPGSSAPSLAGSEVTSVPSASPLALRPYQLRVLESSGSPVPTRTITTMTDCGFLRTDWLRSYCGLTLRSDWRSIVGPTDPFVEPPDGTDSVTWMAALTRAEIDGDTTFCLDAAARFWVSAGSVNKPAPGPGTTYAPVRPVAVCIADFRNVATKGSFSGPADGLNVIELLVDRGAGAKIDGGPSASFDPIVGCAEPMRRAVCNEVFDAVAAFLGSRQGQVGSLLVQAEPIGCSTASSPCPPPSSGTWLGAARVAIAATEHYYDVIDVGGKVTVVEVPAP